MKKEEGKKGSADLGGFMRRDGVTCDQPQWSSVQGDRKKKRKVKVLKVRSEKMSKLKS